MILSLIFGMLVSAVMVGADASPPHAVPTGGILTPPRLHFTPPTSRRWRASPLQLLLSSCRKSSHRCSNDMKCIDEEFINSRAIQYAAAKKAIPEPRSDEVASPGESGFWPPWPFNHLSSRGRSADGAGEEAGQGSGGGLDYKKDAGLLWRYISHRARVGARQIQQRELSVRS